MALVMLPSDLPWWTTVQKKLNLLQNNENNLDRIIELMQQIHDLCNVSLDPDDDTRDSTVFNGLRIFIENDLTNDEKTQFLNTTIKTIAKRALTLKSLRPARGLSFSLQQQADSVKLDRSFIVALLANAFFSTFPKRTEKTHPTLQDFNFTKFFRSLHSNSQKAKLRSFLYYFDWFELQSQKQDNNFKDYVRFSRKVMNGKQWLTIEDWAECSLPLCSIDIKHNGRIENSSSLSTTENIIQTIFTSSRIGGDLLNDGNSQECIQLFTIPESIISLLFIESLEDNEALLTENVYQLTKILDPKNKAILQKYDEPKRISLIFIDPENYCTFPNVQFEEDNILRELNKCLLAFRQNTTCKIMNRHYKRRDNLNNHNNNVRLSPVGESGSNSPKDGSTQIIIKAPSTNTLNSSIESYDKFNDTEKRRSWLIPEPPHRISKNERKDSAAAVASVGDTSELSTNGRRRRFIVLGSSGEYLPVNREPLIHPADSSAYSSCDSENDDDDYHTARNSFDMIDEGRELILTTDTPEKRQRFVDRLKEALKQSSNYTESTASSYAVGISLSGSHDEGDAVRLKRGGSTGFVLTEDQLDEDFYKSALAHEKEWLEKFRSKQQSALPKKEFNESSKYSFSTDVSSELEEVYDQLSKWADESNIKDQHKEIDPRDEAVLYFANSLLKRTLSESFVGIPLNSDGLLGNCHDLPAKDHSEQDNVENEIKEKTSLNNMRSLSLELAKHKHRLAAQLISELRQKHLGRNTNLWPIATGNWGCGSTRNGDVQLKLIIQWLAASVAGLPILIYYTNGDEKLSKLDTLMRILRDRKWTVGELTIATLEYAKSVLDGHKPKRKNQYEFLFDKLLGI